MFTNSHQLQYANKEHCMNYMYTNIFCLPSIYNILSVYISNLVLNMALIKFSIVGHSQDLVKVMERLWFGLIKKYLLPQSFPTSHRTLNSGLNALHQPQAPFCDLLSINKCSASFMFAVKL